MLFRLSSFALCSSLIACGPPAPGDGGGGGGGGATPTTPAAQAAAMSAALCQSLVRCMSTRTMHALHASMGHKGMDVASCQVQMSGPGSNLDRVKSGLEAGTITFSTEHWAACKSSLGTTCLDNASAVCERVLVGTVAEEGGCFVDEECASADNGQAGECSASANQCGTCSLRALEAGTGESCAEIDCADDLRCNGEAICEAALTDNGGSAGDACEAEPYDPVGDCDRGADLLCINATCQATEFSSEAGADCGSNGVLCEGGLVCPIDTSGGSSQCTQARVAGEACIEMGPADGALMTACVSDAFCSAEERVCAAKKGVNEACDGDNHCSNDNCIDGVCAPSVGEPSWQACP
ncbi:MAG: hypothetical protein OSB21_03760 [Myxococcota bacterium]|nr:hypothetical protein [Myxococcota bacterium]